MCYDFVLAFLFLVLFVCSQTMKLHCFVPVLSVFFFVNKTKWSSCLHLVVLFLFLCCFVLNFCFCHSFQKKTGHGKKRTYSKNAEKRTKNQLAQLCSQIVFLLLGDELKKSCLMKTYTKSGFSILNTILKKWKKCQKCENWVKNLSKVESKICPSMLRNIVGQIFASKTWYFLSSSFLKRISYSLQKEEYFW